MSETFECYATVEAVSARAILFEIEETKVWIPRSQMISDHEDLEAGNAGDIEMTMWIAEQKGLN